MNVRHSCFAYVCVRSVSSVKRHIVKFQCYFTQEGVRVARGRKRNKCSQVGHLSFLFVSHPIISFQFFNGLNLLVCLKFLFIKFKGGGGKNLPLILFFPEDEQINLNVNAFRFFLFNCSLKFKVLVDQKCCFQMHQCLTVSSQSVTSALLQLSVNI